MAAQGLSRTQIKSILLLAMSSLFDDLYDLVWKPRCDLTVERQLAMGLTQRSKKIKYRNRSASSNSAPSSHSTSRNSSLDSWSQWVHSSLVFGTNWLNFRRLLEYFQFPVVVYV